MQIAAKLSRHLGREIVHVKLTDEERVQKLLSLGLPQHLAGFLVSLERTAADGMEERMNDVVEQVTGRPPRTFDSFLQEHKTAWDQVE